MTRFQAITLGITVCVMAYLMLTGDSPLSTTLDQATMTLPFAIALVVGLGFPVWRRWSDARTVREIRRNQMKRRAGSQR